MVRPKKTGLDYFNIDIDIELEESIQILQAKHGLEGFGYFIKLLIKIYRNGYYMHFGERQQIMHSNNNSLPFEECKKILKTCIDECLFDSEKYAEFEILTSRGIQKRFLKALDRREEIIFFDGFLCITEVNVYKNLKIVDNNPLNVNKKYTKHSIVKQSIEEHKKEGVLDEKIRKIIFNKKTSEFENITDAHRTQWEKAYPAVVVLTELRRMEAWAAANPNNRKSNWQKFIVNWLSRAQDKAPVIKKSEKTIFHNTGLPPGVKAIEDHIRQRETQDNSEVVTKKEKDESINV